MKTAVRVVVFDLDGTLLDTLDEISAAANTVLERRGWPTHDREDYRYFIGDGVGKLVDRIVPEGHRDAASVRELVAEVGAEYHRRANELTQVYEGITELLTALRERGIRLAVLSNKPHALTVECMKQFFPDYSFAAVRGQQEDVPRKPDPAGAHLIVEQLGVTAAECLYVGDTKVDMQTARAAGMSAVGVLWGFRDRAELEAHGADSIVATPAEILALVDR